MIPNDKENRPNWPIRVTAFWLILVTGCSVYHLLTYFLIHDDGLETWKADVLLPAILALSVGMFAITTVAMLLVERRKHESAARYWHEKWEEESRHDTLLRCAHGTNDADLLRTPTPSASETSGLLRGSAESPPDLTGIMQPTSEED